MSCGNCARFCKHFEEEVCRKYEKLPYVCNGCHSRHRCFRRKMVYDAKIAQEEYAWTFSDAHKGIAISEEVLDFLDSVVSPAIKNGLSVSVIWEQHKDEMPVSMKTVYAYIDIGLIRAGNLDLRLKLRRQARKKSSPVLHVDKAFPWDAHTKIISYTGRNTRTKQLSKWTAYWEIKGERFSLPFFSPTATCSSCISAAEIPLPA